jgi:hypothetical protein
VKPWNVSLVWAMTAPEPGSIGTMRLRFRYSVQRIAELAAANHSGSYEHPANGQRYPKVQLVTVRDLLDGTRPKLPLTMLPYFLAQRRPKADEAVPLGLNDDLPHSA